MLCTVALRPAEAAARYAPSRSLARPTVKPPSTSAGSQPCEITRTAPAVPSPMSCRSAVMRTDSMYTPGRTSTRPWPAEMAPLIVGASSGTIVTSGAPISRSAGSAPSHLRARYLDETLLQPESHMQTPERRAIRTISSSGSTGQCGEELSVGGAIGSAALGAFSDVGGAIGSAALDAFSNSVRTPSLEASVCIFTPTSQASLNSRDRSSEVRTFGCHSTAICSGSGSGLARRRTFIVSAWAFVNRNRSTCGAAL